MGKVFIFFYLLLCDWLFEWYVEEFGCNFVNLNFNDLLLSFGSDLDYSFVFDVESESSFLKCLRIKFFFWGLLY